MHWASRGDFRGRLAAELGGETAEGLDHILQFAEPAIVGQHAKETASDRVDLQHRHQGANGLAGFHAADQRVGRKRAQLGRFRHGLL